MLKKKYKNKSNANNFKQRSCEYNYVISHCKKFSCIINYNKIKICIMLNFKNKYNIKF